MQKEEKLGKNIKDIRKAYGERQEELGKVIAVANTTVSMYEGGRVPDMETMEKIARHYGIPIDCLMNGDFSQMDFKGFTVTWDSLMKIWEVQFPIIYSDIAMQNQHFAKGYKRTEEIVNKLKRAYGGILENEIERALEEYQAVLIEEPKIVEAAANMLWLTFVNYALISDKHSVKLGKAVLDGKGTKTDFVKKYVLRDCDDSNSSKEDGTNRKAFVKDSQEAIMFLIRILKNSKNYDDLADYYLAIRYSIGMVDNQYGEDFNKAIGIEMLKDLVILGNKYAINYFNIIKNL